MARSRGAGSRELGPSRGRPWLTGGGGMGRFSYLCEGERPFSWVHLGAKASRGGVDLSTLTYRSPRMTSNGSSARTAKMAVPVYWEDLMWTRAVGRDSVSPHRHRIRIDSPV